MMRVLLKPLPSKEYARNEAEDDLDVPQMAYDYVAGQFGRLGRGQDSGYHVPSTVSHVTIVMKVSVKISRRWGTGVLGHLMGCRL